MVLYGLSASGKTVTITTESGAFYRRTIRKGNKRKTTTKKLTKNEKKVILCRLGDFEVYVYPFEFPDSVFIGKFPVSTTLDAFTYRQLFTAFNRVRWYLENNWQNERFQTKQAKTTRQAIVSAYNRGLLDVSGKRKGGKMQI